MTVLSNSQIVQSIIVMFINIDIFKACKDGDYEAVKKYIKKKGCVNVKDPNTGLSLLQTACKYHGKECRFLFSKRKFDIIELLLKNNADVNMRYRNGMTALHILCKYYHGFHREEFINLLLAYGANVNGKDKYGRTPLHYICYNASDNLQSAKFLVKNGADINAIDKTGSTPLHHACCQLHISNSVARFLIEMYADASVKNNNGNTCLHYVCACGDLDVAMCLLGRVNINEKNYKGNTPLHNACENSYAIVVNTLISYGGNMNIINNNGITPLNIAKKNNMVIGY